MIVRFDTEKPTHKKINLGRRLKELRKKGGQTQKELAKIIGVTPSTISQIESNLILPSIPALLKIAETFSVDIGFFFNETGRKTQKTVFSNGGSTVSFQDLPKETISGRLLTPLDFGSKAEPHIIEISPQAKLPSHFFMHKGEEIGYIISGKLQVVIKNMIHELKTGDLIYLTEEFPSKWKNPGEETAKLFWIKIT
jgi:DNA-binding XRE family transcriptional regulator